MSEARVYGVPRIPPGIIDRAGLIARLHEGGAITTVTAGSGFGKTTLVAVWAADVPMRGVWVDAAATGRDAASFWRGVFRLLSESGVVLDAPAPEEDELGDEGRRAEAIAAFARRLEQPLLLVIDNTHAIDVDAIAPDLVSFVRFARRSRVVVIDRRRRFRPTTIASDVEETRLTAADLVLTAEETALVVDTFRRRGGGVAEREDVHRSALGVVGLVRRIAAAPASTGSHEKDIVDDLVLPWASDVEDDGTSRAGEAHAAATGLPSAALSIAALDAVTVEEGATHSGLDAAVVARALDAAEERGIGRWIESGSVSRFTFAPVVVRGARSVLSAWLPAAERRRLAARTAQLLALRGDAAEAFSLAIDAEDFDLAVEIGKRCFLELLRDDAAGVLARLRRVPLTRLRSHPLLVLFIAMLHAQSRRGLAAALLHFRLAEQLSRATERSSPPDDRAVMVGVRSAALRMQGRFDKAVPVAREFLDRFDRLTMEEQDRLSSLSRHLLWQAAHTFFFAGDTATAIGAAQRMLAVPAPSPDGEDRGVHHALTMIAAMHAIRGDGVTARETLAEASTHPPRNSPFYHVWGRTAEAVLAIEDGDVERALERITSLDHDMAGEEYWPIDLIVRATCAVGDDRVDDAIEVLRSVLSGGSLPRQASATHDGVFALSAILALAARPTGTAKAVLRHASTRSGLVVLVEALIALRDGEAAKALMVTGNVLDPRPDSPRLRAAALLVRAISAARSDHREAAVRAARDAIAAMGRHGLATPWLVLDETERAEVLALCGNDAGPDAAMREALDRMPVLFSDRRRVERLTDREHEVLKQLVSGATIPEIALESGVSINTVKTQRSRIYRKLGVDNRSDAARIALEHDIV